MCEGGALKDEKRRLHAGLSEKPLQDTNTRQSARQCCKTDSKNGCNRRHGESRSAMVNAETQTNKEQISTVWRGSNVAATVPGSHEMQRLDITIRKPTAAANVEGAVKRGGFSSCHGKKEKSKKCGNWKEIGLDTVKPISFELDGKPGRQTTTALQGLTTKLAGRTWWKAQRSDRFPKAETDVEP